tara:strand:- start:51 stop:194 length:144 start_codon:yes stop_codon:yes gene_type:complete
MYKVITMAALVLLMSGCSMLTEKMNQVKCGMMTCEVETPVATDEVRG